MEAHIEQDAREFGLHVRQGGWRLGLLVARNVEKGKGTGGGGTDGSHRRDHDGEKVSAQAFAKAAREKTTADRVLRHLDAWNRAAEAGHVPPAASLSPSDEVDLDRETLPEWGEFYKAGKGGYNGGPGRTPSVAEAKATLDRLPTQDRARVVAEEIAGSHETAEAVAAHPVAVSRVGVAVRRQREKAETRVRAEQFEQEQDNQGLAVIRVGSAISTVKGSLRQLVLAYQEAEAANSEDDELRALLRSKIVTLKGDVIVALDTLVGEGVDAALAMILQSEEATT